MFRAAMLADIKPETFFKLTPRELFVNLDCFRVKREEQTKYDLAMAWQQAYFQRVIKFPKLKDVITPEEKKQTEQDILEALKIFTLQTGGEIR